MANSINATSTGNGGIVTTGDDSGVLNIQTNETTAISIDASQSVDFTNNIDAPNTFGFKNRIINGDMRIDQRNAGASSTPAGSSGGTYTLDRWCYQASATGKFTVQQNAGSVTPPAGFSKYLGLTVASAVTVTTSEYFNIYQVVEASNMADLNWGTASAATATLSFWVRSSLTGTFGGSLRNGAVDLTYPFSYTISAANTWERKTITVSGPTSGTWETGNTYGIYIALSLGSGTTNLGGTVNTWGAGNYQGPSGSGSVVGTAGATFYMTGVQLEKGTQATSFDFRSYGTELALCQRYYQRSTSGGSNYCHLSNWGSNASTTTVRCTYPLKTSLRSAPSSVDFSNLCVDDNATAPAVTALAIYNTAAPDCVALQATVASGLTTFRPAILANVSGVGYIGISAEL